LGEINLSSKQIKKNLVIQKENSGGDWKKPMKTQNKIVFCEELGHYEYVGDAKHSQPRGLAV
jgi:hypothetical protein